MKGTLAFALLPLLVLALGCQAEPRVEEVELEPVEETGLLPGAATTSARGIELTIDAQPWAGNPVVLQSSSPYWVKVVNDSDTPVRILYSDFALLGATRRYQAVPPMRVDIDAGAPVVVGQNGWSPVPGSQLESSGFHITPYWDPVFIDMEVARERWEPDVGYYEEYGGFWKGDLVGPSQLMEMSIPEGVLYPGGRVMGFMFFEQVDPAEEKVDLVAEFDDATSGATYATTMLPFEVKD